MYILIYTGYMYSKKQVYVIVVTRVDAEVVRAPINATQTHSTKVIIVSTMIMFFVESS